MKKVGTALRGLLRAAAVGVLMLLVPSAASAHGAADHPTAAGAGAAAGQHAINAQDADCLNAGMKAATGHGLHCHRSSLPAMAAGENKVCEHDQATSPAANTPGFVASDASTYSLPASRAPIAAPPPHILFGNFRS